MPVYTIGVVERGLACAPPKVVSVPVNSTTSIVPVGGGAPTNYNGTQILPDQTGNANGVGVEIGSLFIQNTGPNVCYISIGVIGCDATLNYHTQLFPGQQKALVNRQSVWAFCNIAGGTTIAIEQYNRVTGNNGIIRGGNPIT